MMCLLVALLALIFTSCQGCLTPEEMAHAMYVAADADHDGILHMTEMIDWFNNFDTNHDGRVSRNEYHDHLTGVDATMSELAHELYDLYDVNGDHHLELDDYVAFYRRIDTNADDSVSEAEYKAYWTARFNELHHVHGSICSPA